MPDVNALSRMLNAIHSAGGVIPATTLIAKGHSRHHIARAIDTGQIIRVRRNWIALPSADPVLQDAARRGVVVSCVSLARRLGLWVPGGGECLHVAAKPRGNVADASGIVVHWRVPAVPRHPDSLVDSLENALILVSTCVDHEGAVAVWDSAFRTRAASRDVLARMRLPPAARRVLADTHLWADSGLESLFIVRLRWLDIRIVPQAWIQGHRVDFLLGDRLVVQLDGGTHVGRQRSRDIAHDAELALRGYHVLRFSYAQVVDDWPHVQDVIMRAVAQGLHLR